MRHKIFFLSVILAGFFTSLQAQALLEFEETTFDFGEIKEGQAAVHTFHFKNTGNQTLLISRVKASCGCTTPYWTKEPVAPGESGMIKASYNSRNRPGHFNKSITVQANTDQGTYRLYIKGKVIREAGLSQKKPSASDLKNSPRIHIEEPELKAGLIEKGQKVSLFLSLENKGKQLLRLNHLSSACNCVKFSDYPPAGIAPGETKELELIYQPRHSGKHTETVFLHTNDRVQPKSRLKIISEVKESLGVENMMKENAQGFN